MVLAHRQRRTIDDTLTPILGDEETDAMLAHFPSTPGEEPVTVAALDTRLAQLQSGLTAVIYRTVVTSLIGGLSVGMGVAAAVGAAMGGG